MSKFVRLVAAKLTHCLAATALLASPPLFRNAAHAAPPALPELRIPPASAPSLAHALELINGAERAQNAEESAARLAAAKVQLEAYIEKPASDVDLPTAETLLGRALLLEGRMVIARAERAAGDAAAQGEEHEKLMQGARDPLRRAELAFSAALEQLKQQGAAFPKFLPEDDPNRPASDRIKESTLQALMLHALAAEELGSTFVAGSEQANEHFKAAAERYERIYKDYRTLVVGPTARLKQGICWFRMGDTRRALGFYDDILTQPRELELLRRLRVTAMQLSMECWNTEREKLYELAFSQGEEYLTEVRPEEESWAEWQAIRYNTARGYQLAAAGLGAKREADRVEYLEKARSHAEKLARTTGPYQEAARSLLGPKP
jgi:hypothetical protein